LSNGAIMSHRLACEAADLFAAVAPVAGGLNVGGNFTACQPTRPVPIIMFHGTTDQNYPIEGGDGSGELGVPETFYPVIHPTDPNTLDDWRTLNAATDPGTVSYSQGDASCDTYAGNAPVVMCIVAPQVPILDAGVVYDGGGHAWPGGVKGVSDEADVPSRDLDASEMMWQFFEQHPMP
jgi:polyhydroxybutyrate depolymerase